MSLAHRCIPHWETFLEQVDLLKRVSLLWWLQGGRLRGGRMLSDNGPYQERQECYLVAMCGEERVEIYTYKTPKLLVEKKNQSTAPIISGLVFKKKPTDFSTIKS